MTNSAIVAPSVPSLEPAYANLIRMRMVAWARQNNSPEDRSIASVETSELFIRRSVAALAGAEFSFGLGS
jgi:hypothetical protein